MEVDLEVVRAELKAALLEELELDEETVERLLSDPVFARVNVRIKKEVLQ